MSMVVAPRRRIRVLFAINDFVIGGAQKLHVDLFHHLDQTKFEIHLLTLIDLPHKVDFYAEVPEGIIVHKMSFTGFSNISSWLKLARLLRSVQPDVCISSLFFSNTVMRLAGIFVGYTSIAIEHNTYKAKTNFQKLVDCVLSRSTYTIVAVSNTVRSFTSKQEKIPESKFTVISNGLDLVRIDDFLAKKTEKSTLRAQCNIPAVSRVVLSVARLTVQKNHAMLIDAFVRFHASHPDFILVLVGDGGLRKALEDRVNSAGAGAYIILAGETKEVLPYYCLADFFVSSSCIEGFGIAHVEALRTGLPVLSTKTAGPDEFLVEGKNGFFITDYTSKAIEEGLLRMVAARADFDSEYSKHTVDRYDIRVIAKSYESILISSVA